MCILNIIASSRVYVLYIDTSGLQYVATNSNFIKPGVCLLCSLHLVSREYFCLQYVCVHIYSRLISCVIMQPKSVETFRNFI